MRQHWPTVLPTLADGAKVFLGSGINSLGSGFDIATTGGAALTTLARLKFGNNVDTYTASIESSERHAKSSIAIRSVGTCSLRGGVGRILPVETSTAKPKETPRDQSSQASRRALAVVVPPSSRWLKRRGLSRPFTKSGAPRRKPTRPRRDGPTHHQHVPQIGRVEGLGGCSAGPSPPPPRRG